MPFPEFNSQAFFKILQEKFKENNIAYCMKMLEELGDNNNNLSLFLQQYVNSVLIEDANDVRDGITLAWWLADTSQGRAILATHSAVLAQVDLNKGPANPRHIEYGTSVAWWLAATSEGRTILATHSALLAQVDLNKGSANPKHIEYGTSVAYWLAGTSQGRAILVTRSALLAQVDLNKGPANPKHIDCGKSVAYWLAASPEGRAILAANSALLAEVDLNKGPANPENIYYNMSVAFWLAATPEGQAILAANSALLAKVDLNKGSANPKYIDYGTGVAFWLAATPAGRAMLAANPMLLTKYDLNQYPKNNVNLKTLMMYLLENEICQTLISNNLALLLTIKPTINISRANTSLLQIAYEKNLVLIVKVLLLLGASIELTGLPSIQQLALAAMKKDLESAVKQGVAAMFSGIFADSYFPNELRLDIIERYLQITIGLPIKENKNFLRTIIKPYIPMMYDVKVAYLVIRAYRLHQSIVIMNQEQTKAAQNMLITALIFAQNKISDFNSFYQDKAVFIEKIGQAVKTISGELTLDNLKDTIKQAFFAYRDSKASDNNNNSSNKYLSSNDDQMLQKQDRSLEEENASLRKKIEEQAKALEEKSLAIKQLRAQLSDQSTETDKQQADKVEPEHKKPRFFHH